MNNQQITDPSLVNIQNELLNEDSNRKKEAILFNDKDLLILSPVSIRKNIIILCICLVAFFFLFWVYYKWMCIPIRKHNIEVEHLVSADSSATVCANVIIDDIKNININNESKLLRSGFGRLLDPKGIFLYRTGYNFKYSKEYKQTYPGKRNFTGSLSEIIGQDLYDELNDTCQKHHLDLNKYHGLFYYRHLDNEKYAKGRVFKYSWINYKSS